MAGIYIHIPFCKRKCVYCDFYSTAQYGLYGRAFIDAACRELEEQKDFLGLEPVKTVYFGGGTPSLYSPDDIASLLEAVGSRFDVSRLSEVTLEANPEDLDPGYLSLLHNKGVNRLSIGIQSFDDNMLQFMRRRHNAAKALLSVMQARQAGFTNISIDLIYGIPGMTLADWEKTLKKAVELAPEHISAYHLTFEAGTILGRKKEKGEIFEIPDADSQRQFELLHSMLAGSGYEHYEVSNFARPGYRSRHNSSYWTGEPYLGIGPGAHSYDGAGRRWCEMTVKDYVAAGPEYKSEILSLRDRYNELIMTALRTVEGINIHKIPAEYKGYFISEAEKLVRSGKLSKDRDRYHMMPEEFLTSDSVISSLFI